MKKHICRTIPFEGELRKTVKVFECDYDVPDEFVPIIKRVGKIAWDIETSGLDWKNDQIGTCQIYIPDEVILITKINGQLPVVLRSVLSDNNVLKVFHHAMFDLRFMAYKWNVTPLNIACTKIASKILNPQNGESTSLNVILRKYLNVWIDKHEQRSNWLSNELTKRQLNYAAKDVIYLFPLLTVLYKELDEKGLLHLAEACFKHIPTRVTLDVLGYKDVFEY